MAKYWACYDMQLSKYLNNGRNVNSLRKCIEEVWQYWISGADIEEADINKMEKWGLIAKKEWLENTGFRFDTSNKKFKEFDD